MEISEFKKKLKNRENSVQKSRKKERNEEPKEIKKE